LKIFPVYIDIQMNISTQKEIKIDDIRRFVKEFTYIVQMVAKPGESIRFSKQHWNTMQLTQYQMDSMVKALKKNFPGSNIEFITLSERFGTSELFLVVDWL